MQEAVDHPTVRSEETNALTALALRAEAWSGESFLHPGEDPAEVLAEGRARRRALDAALSEMEAGRRSPSPEWKVDFALMLGLERVLTDKPPRLASGTELRRHQIDALAGMLAELIARHELEAENGNGPANADLAEARVEEDEEELEEDGRSRSRRPARRARSSASMTTSAPSAATASATPPPPARRSPPPASSRPPGRWACSSSRTGGCWSTSSPAT